MPQALQNTLYLLTPGLSVHRDGLALRIEQEKELKLSLPVHNLESVFVFGADIYLSPAVLRLCWEHGAAVCFFTDWGRLEARVEGVPRGSVMLRRAQHRAADTPATTAALARAFVAGKLHNTRWLLARSARDAAGEEDAAALRAVTDQLAHLERRPARKRGARIETRSPAPGRRARPSRPARKRGARIETARAGGRARPRAGRPARKRGARIETAMVTRAMQPSSSPRAQARGAD